MNNKKICFLLVCSALLFNLLSPANAHSNNFPWVMFLPAIIAQSGGAPSCNDNQAAASVTKADCLRLNGHWYDTINVCSCFTTSDHLLVGSWKDSWDETYITYYPDGTFDGTELGSSFQGIWAPIAANTALRYSIKYDDYKTIILLNNSTYIYKDIPSLGEYYRTN